MIEALTFTGVDARVDPSAVLRLWNQYPLVEFGVLVGPHNGDPRHRRYPPLDLVGQWRDMAASYGRGMALHLCGPHSRSVLQGSIDGALRLSAGFARVQVNAVAYDYGRVSEFAEAVDCGKVILQRRYPPRAEPPLCHPKVEYLQDLSGGRGLSDIDSWPAPSDPTRRWGYAGGLGPSNIARALEFTDEHESYRLWLDMESCVRTLDDWMDLDAVEAVCAAVFPN